MNRGIEKEDGDEDKKEEDESQESEKELEKFLLIQDLQIIGKMGGIELVSKEEVGDLSDLN